MVKSDCFLSQQHVSVICLILDSVNDILSNINYILSD